MSYATQMLETYPRDFYVDKGLLARAIEACFDCSQACTACADDCLSEENVGHMAKCIRTNLDCADICQSTGRVLSRQTEYDANITRAALQSCIQACRSCGDECARHAEHGMDHCRICADACRDCEDACEQVLSAIGG